MRRNGDGSALRLGTRSSSYRQLHEHASALAGDVVGACGGSPRRVGLLATGSERAYAGVIASGYAGAAVVPLSPGFPAERTRQMIEAAELDAVIVDDAGQAVVAELGDALRDIPVIGDPVGKPLAEPLLAESEDIAYILFTSGSTGRPKGVPVSHGNIGAYLDFVHDRYEFGPADVFSHTFDLTFDPAMCDLFASWGSGGVAVSVPQHAYASLARFVAKHEISVWHSGPTVISLVRRVGGLSAGCFPSLRLSLFCSEPLLAADALDWSAAACNAILDNTYGPTETTITCTVHRFDPRTSPGRSVNGVVPIGAIYPGNECLVHDADTGTAAAEGELCVAGSQVFPGYLDPADDEGRFLTFEGRRWYRTGDLVRCLDGGEYAWLGRTDHQVKIRGVRIELPEVEHAVRRLAGVRQAIAVASQGNLLVFCVGDERPTSVLAAELREFLPQALVPHRFVFVDELPLSTNRKIDRKALAVRADELVAAGTPG
ncbi:AMP-binding protein [Labedaea rhizosphaerae]|uniref:AMP-binding protein n=1 Tax=Labedaea rhizosphaerae TaxID=598644 RepID=UPI001FB7A0CA|nr:AMP-binding protein [Labedaea rhizosphaerae]